MQPTGKRHALSTPLLTTKWMIPPTSDNLVSRARLIERLNTGLHPDCRLTLVCAPAGYGKTTLVSSWLQQLHLNSSRHILRAWLTLDLEEDDLARFVVYLVTVLQQVQPGFGEGLLAALQTQRPPAPAMLATWLINDLAEIDQSVVVVLDDYHNLSDLKIQEFMTFLVEHQPSQLCLVISTRADPVLPLARLRARGHLIELRQEDLSFNLEEARSLLSAMRLTLSAEQLAILEERTEGWAAGLQLAALSLRNSEDISGFIEAFSGGHMHIADYLTEEVLAQLPEPVVEFLLQTSILDRLTATLCEAVTEQPQAQKTLDWLSEANLFLIPLDYQQEWYRYHMLFADLLRKRLHLTQGGMIDTLHRRASLWYEEKLLLNPAIEHALAGHDYPRASALITQLGESILMHSEALTLLRWLEALPDESKCTHPILFVYHGLALMLSGKPMGAYQAELEKIAETGDLEPVRGEFETLQALLTIMKGNAPQAIRLCNQALDKLVPERAFFYSLAIEALGMAYTLLGETTSAAQAFEQVAVVTLQSGNVMMALGALSNLAGLQVLQGQLRAASDSYQRVLDLAAENLGKRAPMTGKALFGMGSIAREWNDLEGALKYLEEAVEMFRQSVDVGQSLAYLAISRVKSNLGEWDAAQIALEHARQLARATSSTSLDDLLVEETQARLWIMQGALDPAMDWVRRTGILEKSITDEHSADHPSTAASILVNQAVYLILARIYLGKNQPEDALAVLNPMLEIFRGRGHVRRVIETTALKALALRQQGDIGAATQTLDQALALAEPERFQRTFLDEGEPMARLLYEAAALGIHPAYAGQLLAAFEGEVVFQNPPKGLSQPQLELVEPLSERELEVLKLIAEGLSNREIAEQLVISLSTVKSHTHHIFNRLNVNNRTQAVALARSLGLIQAK